MRDLEAQRYDMNRRAIAKRSDDAKSFVQSLLIANPAKRPSAARAKKHTWIQGRRRSISAEAQRGKLRESYSEDHIAENLLKYAASSKLRKIALMVVAHRADNEAIRDLREAFRSIDTAGEGTITFEEFRVVLERAGISESSIRSTFDAVDHDGTGMISYTEFVAACLEGSSMVKEDMLVEAFDRLDSDDSGFISKENLRDILGNQFSPDLVSEMIADGDFKKTGHIDFEEFMKLMHLKRDKIIVETDVASKPQSSLTRTA